MKFSRFSSTAAEQPSQLRWSGRLFALGIAGIYLSLLVAAAFYLNQNEAAAANSSANHILISGVIISAVLFAISWALKLVHLAQPAINQSPRTRCPLLCESERV